MRTTLNLRTEEELNRKVADNEKRGWTVIRRGVHGGIYKTHWAVMERKEK